MMNFTIGKFYNIDSVVHRLDPRTKLGILFVYIISCFVDRNLYIYLFLISLLGMYICLSRIPARIIFTTIRPIVILALFLAVINIFTTAGVIIWEWSFLKITEEGLYKAIYVFVRWVLVVVGCGMLTYTTKPMDIMRGLEKGLKLKSSWAMIITIAIRFLPILAEEMERIKLAQEVRGANFKQRNVIKKYKLYIGILIPLIQNSLDRAANLTDAMDSRCYTSEKNRTSIHKLKYKAMDYVFILLSVIYIIIVIALALFM